MSLEWRANAENEKPAAATAGKREVTKYQSDWSDYIMSEQTSTTTELKPFFNSKGRAYMFPHEDGRIYKSEREKDRLRILGGRGYAIDAADLERAISMGMKTLILKEKTLKGKTRIYEVSLSEIKQKERPVAIKGIPRYLIYLSRCVLTSGEPEPWQLAEREALKKVEALRTEKQRSEPVQAGLFGNDALIEAAAVERLMA